MEQNDISQPTPQTPQHATPVYPPGGDMPPTSPGQFGGSHDWQRQTDLHHLKLLSIFYYISAGLQAMGGCFGLLYFVIGLGVAAAPPPRTSDGQTVDAAPEFVGGMFMLIGGCVTVFCIVWTVMCIMTGLSLASQTRRTLCMVTAGLMCLSIPLGTILGVFTFIVLSRPGVVAMFNEKKMMM